MKMDGGMEEHNAVWTLESYIEHQKDLRAADLLAVQAALAAQEKAVTAAFLASEKAIVKAEEAQKEYNTRSNEFRGQLDDQAKTLMPRNESIGLFNAIDEKLSALQQRLEQAASAKGEADEKIFLSINTDLKSLRESRSLGDGRGAGINQFWGYIVGGIGIGLAVLSFFK